MKQGEPLKRVAVHALMRKFAPGEGASDDTVGAQVRTIQGLYGQWGVLKLFPGRFG